MTFYMDYQKHLNKLKEIYARFLERLSILRKKEDKIINNFAEHQKEIKIKAIQKRIQEFE